MASIDVIDSNIASTASTTAIASVSSTTAVASVSSTTAIASVSSATAVESASSSEDISDIPDISDSITCTTDIKYTYGDLPELYQSWYPTISSDTELPEKLHCLVPPKTIREWLTRYNSKEEYNRVTFVEAFEIFKTDIAARQPCVIHIRMHCSRGGGFQAYTAHFNRLGEYTINVLGYSDEQRQQLTYDSLYSEDLKYAIVASAARMDR